MQNLDSFPVWFDMPISIVLMVLFRGADAVADTLWSLTSPEVKYIEIYYKKPTRLFDFSII